MAEINKEARDSFYKELTQRLTAEGYGSKTGVKKATRHKNRLTIVFFKIAVISFGVLSTSCVSQT